MDIKLRTWGRRATTVALSLAMAGGGFPIEALQNVAYAEEPVEAVEAEAQPAQPTPVALGNGEASLKDVGSQATADYVWRVIVTARDVDAPQLTFVPQNGGFVFNASAILKAFYPNSAIAPQATTWPAISWGTTGEYIVQGGDDFTITFPDRGDTANGTLTIAIKTVDGQPAGEKTFDITATKVYNLAKATMKLYLDKSEMPTRSGQYPESGDNPYQVTYTGKQFDPKPTDVKYEGKALKEGTDYTVEQVKEGANTNVVLDGNGNPTYAGAATIVADGKDETYYGEGSKSFVIDQCEITGITWSKESAVYTGVAQSPTATGVVEQGQTAPAPSLDVYVSAPTGVESAIDVGDYTFKASLGENANYRFAEKVVVNNPWSFSITPASVTISGVTFEKVYDGDANIYDSTKITSTSATLDGIVEADKSLVEFNSGALKTLTKSISFDGSTAGESKNMKTGADQTSLNDLLANVQDAKKAKNYNVVAKDGVLFAGAGTITPKPLTVSGVKAQDKTYNATKTASLTGGKLDPNEIVSQDDVELAGELKGEFETANVGSGIKVTLNSTQNLTGKDAGNYTPVMAEGQELKADITQAPLTVTAKPQTIWQGGSIATDSSWYEYEPTQLKGQDKLASALLTSSSTAQPTTTGEIVVSDAKVTGAEGKDVTGNYSFTYNKGVLTVKEKLVQTITASDVTATYGDTGKAVVAKTDAEGSKLSYAVKDGGEYIDVDATTGALTIKGAGKVTVTVSATETADHKAATKDVTVTIAKAESTPAEVTANDRTWDGTEQPLVNVSGEAAGGEMRYSTDGYSFFANVPAATEAGEYTVWYKVAGDANHNDSEAKSVKVTVSRKVLALSGAGHVQTYGDRGAIEETDGIMIGTTGQSKRLESFSVSLPEDIDGSIEYRAHVQGIGWVDWSSNGAPCGTTAQSKRVEAVQMQLSGAVADEYNVWYRVHSQTYGWLGWATNGQAAGTAGQSKRAEAVEVQVLRDGQVPEGYVEGQASYIGAATGDAHVQGIGWTGNGSALEFGTTGQSRRLEAISLSAPNQPVAGGIAYEVHAQGIGWMGEVADGTLAGTTGQSRRLEAVRATLTGDMANEFSVWYRVHSQTYGWLGWAHDGDPAGTTGLSKRAEAVDVQILPIGQVPDGFDGSAACIVG